MSISSEDDLKVAVEEVNSKLQEIQDYLQRQPNVAGKIRFPRGFIRTATEQRKRLSFIKNDVLKTNLSYSLILSDIYLWLMIRTDIYGTAHEMVMKAGIFLAGAIAESITKDYLDGKIGKKKTYKERTQKLVDDGVIDAAFQADLDWVWDMRNRMHLMLVCDIEYGRYKIEDYERATLTIRELLNKLK